MYELGKRTEIFGADQLQDLEQHIKSKCFADYGTGRPITFPSLREAESLICGYDQGLGENMIVCESLDDMQQLYDAYYSGGALRIRWYVGHDVGFVTVLNPVGQQEGADNA